VSQTLNLTAMGFVGRHFVDDKTSMSYIKMLRIDDRKPKIIVFRFNFNVKPSNL